MQTGAIGTWTFRIALQAGVFTTFCLTSDHPEGVRVWKGSVPLSRLPLAQLALSWDGFKGHYLLAFRQSELGL